jgi:anthranilate phosphoribosyltransferase
MFAPLFHPAMKFAAGPRREIGIRTVFNILGPLTNPAGAHAQVIGVAARPLVERMAEALALLGTHHALIVHGDDGVDEISICAPTQVAEVRDGQVRSYEIEPETFGFRRASPDEVRGADAQTNAEITRAILAGESGARRSVVLLNAAAALVAGGLAPTFDDGVDRAARAIDSGAAAETLRRLVEVSRRYAVAG